MIAIGFEHHSVIARFEAEMQAAVTDQRRWTLARLCAAVDLVVDLQHLALVDGPAYESIVLARRGVVGLWLYELIVAASGMGLREVGPALIEALPHIDMSGYRALLDEVGALDSAARPVLPAPGDSSDRWLRNWDWSTAELGGVA